MDKVDFVYWEFICTSVIFDEPIDILIAISIAQQTITVIGILLFFVC